MQIQTVLLILAAFLLALGAAVFYYYRSKIGLKLRITLTLLRFVSFFSGLVLLINPEFSKNTYHIERANLILMVDESSSIVNLGDEAEIADIIDGFTQETDLQDKFSIHPYTFSNEVQPLDSISFQGNSTDIFKGLQTIKSTFSNTNNAVVLITDGNQTYGRDYEYFDLDDQSILNTVVVGDTTTYQDVAVGIVNSNRYAFLDNQFPLEVQAIYAGKSEVNVAAKVFLDGRVVHQESLEFSAIRRAHTISTRIKAQSTGIKTIKIVLGELENEKNTQNNNKEIAIEIIDERTVVGIISSFKHPDIGALKKAIESNEQRQVVLLPPQATFKQLEEIDIFVFYQPDDQFENVYNFLKQRGGGSFTVTGTHTDWGFLNEKVQNVAFDGFGQDEEILPIKNEAFGIFDSSSIGMDDFPPLLGELGELDISGNPKVLAHQKIRGVNLQEPLFFVFDQDENNKQAFLLGENIWKWRLSNFRNNQDFSSFDELIGKLVFFLSSSGKKERLRLEYENVYENATEALIRASFFNRAYNFEKDARLNLHLTGENGWVRDIPMLLAGDTYQVDLSDLEEGEYAFTITETTERISKSGQFRILDFDLEKQFMSANHVKLERLSKRNSGNIYYPNQTAQLIRELVNDSDFIPIQKSTRNVVSLIDFRIVLGIMVLALTLEWFIRKYNGLI
ncbi:MAG: VWA domain-containing protein [Bacteroidota bacterium]